MVVGKRFFFHKIPKNVYGFGIQNGIVTKFKTWKFPFSLIYENHNMSTQQHDQQIPANCYYVDPNTAPLTVAAMNDCRDFVQTMLHKTQCYMHG